MKNFKSVKTTREGIIVRNENGDLKFKTTCSHFVASHLQRFVVDVKNDIYVQNGYGAFVDNINVKINSIDELKNFKDKKTDKNPYQYFLNLIEQGYDLVAGDPFPNECGYNNPKETGIYCKNYLKFIENKKVKNTKAKVNNVEKQDSLQIF